MITVWARLELLTNLKLLGAVSTCLIAVLGGSFTSAATAQRPRLTQEDLQNPERVIQVVKDPMNEKNQATAKELYQDALQRMAKKNWGSAGKSFGESALYYPTAKAFIGFAEAIAHISRRHDRTTKLRMLEGICNYLASAVAVDEIQKQLTLIETEQLKRERDCISTFLATQKPQADCKLLDIAFGKGD